MGLFTSIFGDPNEKEIQRLKPTMAQINALEPKMIKLQDGEFGERTERFKKQIKDNLANNPDLSNLHELPEEEQIAKHRQAEMAALQEILPEAFALVREASKRTTGLRHFDVQLLGGLVLHEGKIAEMKTGEGKTLVASLALYLNALTGRGAHLITVNDYLARRDAGWMGPIYNLLGLSTSTIGHEASWLYDPSITTDDTDERLRHFRPVTRDEAYGADITYGTNNEFGFDYLRDNMAQDISQLVQKNLHFGIVDEVDSILIDEARTPLIISAPAEESTSLYRQYADLVIRLKPEEDYLVDEKMHAVTLTDGGMEKVEGILGFSIYDAGHVDLVHHLEESLKAKALFKRDRDYVIKEGEIVIVDEFTGRLMPGRRYSEGLHQAIEAKEKVEIKRESDTLATISFQNLFRMYEKLSGMTGTAATEAEEFFKIYKLDVTVMPPNKDCVRQDLQDQIYKSDESKFKAVVKTIQDRSNKGQPILVGTISVEKSERLSKLLRREGVKHNVLNAKHHEREAKIIAEAGSIGAVTVATNMAGRGVDIILGGTPPEVKSGEPFHIWEQAHEKVISLGGLHVIGTERHEARRIDNQLRGRAGRQGDPGSSQFFVSLEDDLMRIFGGERLKNLMERLGLPDDMPIEHKMISRSIEQAQKRVEGNNFDIRKHLVEYDDVMNKHRELIYQRRKRILLLGTGHEEDEDWLHRDIVNALEDTSSERKDYEEKTKRYGVDVIKQIEKAVYLRTYDLMWIDHLNAMEALREGIGLRGYSQREPLVEYKHEAYTLFQRLTKTIDAEAIDILLRVDIQGAPVAPTATPVRQMVMKGADESMAGGAIHAQTQNQAVNQQNLIAGETTSPADNANQSSSGDVNVTIRHNPMASLDMPASKQAQEMSNTGQTAASEGGHKVGRNDPCPCGSGKKYKKCHGK